MKRFLTYPGGFGHFIEAGFRYVFAFLFVYAGMSKLLDFETFQVQLAQSPLLSAYAGFVAWAVPVSEFFIGILLLIDRIRVWGLSGFFFLMVLFTTYIIIILNFADFVPCSCGGVLEKMSWGQHLVFNLVFVLVSGVLLFFQLPGNWRRRVLILGSQIILGVGVVSVLFAFSERKMHRNNAFQRRYLPHPIERVASYDLEYDTYYIAGVTDTVVYLANVGAPLLLREVMVGSDKIKDYTLVLSDLSLPFQNVRTTVVAPYFYLSDGSVPVVFKGLLQTKYGDIYSYRDAFFSEIVPSDTSHIGIVTVADVNRTRILGLINKSARADTLTLKTGILKNTDNHNFGSDGQLMWNQEYERYLYLYYYRNMVEVMDWEMADYYSLSTIDTIREPLLKTVYSQAKNEWVLTGATTTVNRMAATSGSLLFISSDRIGKNEDEKVLKQASVIDVYDFIENQYLYSFYLYHRPDHKIADFEVSDSFLYALAGNELLVYKLSSKLLLSSGLNSKYTARYQEEDRTPEK